MHVEFDPDSSIDWASVFAEQAHSEQLGTGFRGYPYQRGSSGLGGLVSKLLGYVLPLAKRMGRSIGTEALLASGRVAEDLSSGEGFSDSVKRRGRESYDKLINRAVSKLQRGEGRGKGAKNKGKSTVKKRANKIVRKGAPRVIKKEKKKTTTKKTINRKRRTKDIFGQWEPEK